MVCSSSIKGPPLLELFQRALYLALEAGDVDGSLARMAEIDAVNAQKAELVIPGTVIKVRQVELSYSDKEFLVVYEDHGKCFIRIYDLKKVLANGLSGVGIDPVMTQNAPKDHEVNMAKWGPLDRTIYYCTNRGLLIHYDLEESEETSQGVGSCGVFCW